MKILTRLLDTIFPRANRVRSSVPFRGRVLFLLIALAVPCAMLPSAEPPQQAKSVPELPDSLRPLRERIQTGKPNTYPVELPGRTPAPHVVIPEASREVSQPSGPFPLPFPLPGPTPETERGYERGVAFARVGRYAEAIPILQRFMESEENFFLPNESGKSNVRRLIASFPPAAKNMYELLCEAPARSLLEDSLRRNDPEPAARAAALYDDTPSGLNALFLIARRRFEQGRDFEALTLFRRLADRPFEQTESLEPELTALFVSALVKYGRDEEASRRLILFFKHHRELRFGSHRSLASAESALEFYRESYRFAKRDFDGSKVGSSDLRISGRAVRIPRDSSAVFHGGRFLDRKMQGQLIPASIPVVQGESITVRRCLALESYDKESLALQWSQGPITPVISEPMKKYHHVLQRDATTQIRELWDQCGAWFAMNDRTSGCMVCDSNRIYGIEFPLISPQRKEPLYISRNKRTWPLPETDRGNTLTCRDRKSGNIIWSTGQAAYIEAYHKNLILEADQKSEDETLSEKEFVDAMELLRKQHAGETFFCGAPLPIEGRLYLIGRRPHRYELFVLDASNGRTIANLPLALANDSPCRIPTPILSGMSPVARGGIILCPTPGMLVAVSQGSLEPVWSWRSSKQFERRIAGSDLFRNLVEAAVNMPASNPRSILVARNDSVFFSPWNEPDHVVCLEPDTGRVRWDKKYAALLSVEPAEDRLVVVTLGAAHIVHATDGRSERSVPIPPERFPFGTGRVEKKRFCQPLDDGSILSFAIHDASEKVSVDRTGLDEGGNLVVSSGLSVLQTPEWLATFSSGNQVKLISADESDSVRSAPSQSVSEWPPCAWNVKAEPLSGARVRGEKLPELPALGKRLHRGRELGRLGKACECLRGVRFYLDENKTHVLVEDSTGRPVTEIPVNVAATRKTAIHVRPEHRLVLAEEGMLLIVVRTQFDQFEIRYAMSDRYARDRNRDVRTVHEERRGFEAEWNAWYREMGLNPCRAGSSVAFLNSFGILTIVDDEGGEVKGLCEAKQNEKFVRVFAVGSKLFTLSLRFESQSGSDGKRRSVRKYHLEERSPDDGSVIHSRPLPYDPVCLDGAILLVHSRTNGKYYVVNAAQYVASVPQVSTNNEKSMAGLREIPLAGESVLRILKSMNMSVLRTLDGRVLLWDRDDGKLIFETTAKEERLQGRPINFNVWRDGNDYLVFYRFPGVFPDAKETAKPIPPLASDPVARGRLMRYSPDGTEQWSDFVSVEKTFLFHRQLDILPCLLWGKSDIDDHGAGYYAVLGLNKRTGKSAFHAKIPTGTDKRDKLKQVSDPAFFVDTKKKTLVIILEAAYNFHFEP